MGRKKPKADQSLKMKVYEGIDPENIDIVPLFIIGLIVGVLLGSSLTLIVSLLRGG